MLSKRVSRLRSLRGLAAALLVAAAMGAGCMGEDDNPPVSEVPVPTWEVGQEWHYRSSDGIWQNRTVVGVEERRGFETYKVRVEYSQANEFGRRGAIFWYDVKTGGVIEGQTSLDAQQPGTTRLWMDFPYPPRFPVNLEPATFGGNATIVSGEEKWNVSREAVQKVTGWTTITSPIGTFDVIEIERVNPGDNTSTTYWYAPKVENHVRTAENGKVTLNLSSWVIPD